MSNPMIGNFTVNEVYETVLNKGLTASQANSFVGEWLLVNAGKAKRVFNYSQSFNAIEAACVANFARTFVHTDWIDGESVVQASKTAEEQGFNDRFHRLEADLESLGSNVAMAFTCMANLRQQLKSLLEEIRVELNRINAAIDTRTDEGKFPFKPGLIDSGAFLGKFKINESPMQLWQTAAGMIMLPDIETNPAPMWNDPRTQRFSMYSRYVEENAQVRATFPQAVSKTEFVRKFGNEKLPDGTFMRDAVAMLPDDATYESLDKMGEDLTARETAALRTTPGMRDAAALSLGISAAAGKLDAAKVEQFNALPANARAALARNGIGTIGELAALSPERVGSIFRREKVQDVGRGDIASAIAIAKSIGQL